MKLSEKQLRNIIRESVEEYTAGQGYGIRQANGNMSNYQFHAANNNYGDENARMDPNGAARAFGRNARMNVMRGKGANRQMTGANDFDIRQDVNYGKGMTSKAVQRSKQKNKPIWEELREMVDNINQCYRDGKFGNDPLVGRVVMAYTRSMMGLANQYMRQVRGYNMRANKAMATQQQGVQQQASPVQQPVQQPVQKTAMEEAYNPNSVYGLKVTEGWITKMVNQINELINQGIIGKADGAGTNDIDVDGDAAGLAKRKNETALMTQDFLELLRMEKNAAMAAAQGGGATGVVPAPVPDGGQGGTTGVVPAPVPVPDGGDDGQGGGESSPEDDAFKDKKKTRGFLGRLAKKALIGGGLLLLMALGMKGCSNLAKSAPVDPNGEDDQEMVTPSPEQQSMNGTFNVGQANINEYQQLAEWAQNLPDGVTVSINVTGNNVQGSNWNAQRQNQLDMQRMNNIVKTIQQANPNVTISQVGNGSQIGDWQSNTGSPMFSVNVGTYMMERRKKNKSTITESELTDMIRECVMNALRNKNRR